nr:methyltransferase-like protein 25 isoform X1 [Leptinotarsa decemlineata]
MTSKCQFVMDQIECLISYLEPLLPLANFHMVDYFSKDEFENFLSNSIKQEIKKVGQQEVISSIFKNDYKEMPNLCEYVNKSKQFTLKNIHSVCFTTNSFLNHLKELSCEEFLRLRLNIFMTSKKSHEVDILSCVSAALKSISRTSHLIDIGDGRGYLSSMLALHYKIPILGVDASVINTHSAVKRVEKLSKIWNSVVKVDNEKTRKTTKDLYKQITKYVDEDIDLDQLITDVFLEKPCGLGLVGLHTCGDLAPTSIRIFSANEQIKTICNVGCCYHFISESFENEGDDNLCSTGFPMSEFLKQKKFVIGRSARMIAAQSVDRIMDGKDLPNRTIFYRALFEVLLDRKCSFLTKEKRQVGRFRKQCSDFSEYVNKAMKKLDLKIDITDLEINEVYEEHEARIHELNLFYLIRGMLSPVIESLILLDRLLFLHEQGHDNSFLVQLFDPVVSPRCYGLIAMK